jgi:hypothetical protein
MRRLRLRRDRGEAGGQELLQRASLTAAREERRSSARPVARQAAFFVARLSSASRQLLAGADARARIKDVFGRPAFCGPLVRRHKIRAGQKLPGIALFDPGNYGVRDCARNCRERRPPRTSPEAQARGHGRFPNVPPKQQFHPHFPRFEEPRAKVDDYESPTTPTASRERERPESCRVVTKVRLLIRRFAALASGRTRQATSSPTRGEGTLGTPSDN